MIDDNDFRILMRAADDYTQAVNQFSNCQSLIASAYKQVEALNYMLPIVQSLPHVWPSLSTPSPRCTHEADLAELQALRTEVKELRKIARMFPPIDFDEDNSWLN